VGAGVFADLKAEDSAALKVEILKTRRIMAVINGEVVWEAAR
jgi:hypothetical protein